MGLVGNKLYQCDDDHEFATELSFFTHIAPMGETVYAENGIEAMNLYKLWQQNKISKKYVYFGNGDKTECIS